MCAFMLSHFSCAWIFATIWTVATRRHYLWHSPGKDPGMDCHALLQGDCADQWLIPDLLHRFFFNSWDKICLLIYLLIFTQSFIFSPFKTLLIYFNWRIITLQYCDEFYHTLPLVPLCTKQYILLLNFISRFR